MALTNTLSQETLEMLPEYHYAGTFDLMIRDADSVAIYWDLARTSVAPHEDARLSLKITDFGGAEEMLILNQRHGHMLVPVHGTGSHFNFTLGWSDVTGFRPIASESADLPPSLPQREDDALAALSYAVARRGVRPPATARY